MANLMLKGLLTLSAVIGTVSWIFRGVCFQYANFSYVKDNEVLQGSIIATLPGKSTTECEAECVKEYRCKSINIQIAEQRNCELNSENVVDKMANLTLTSKAGWTYKATNYNETLIGGNCKYLKPCAVNHVCVDSCDCPGYICYRCRGINIGINCLANFVLNGLALGMESKKIADSQISVSSINHGSQVNRHSRLNLDSAWCVQRDQQNMHQWIKIFFIRRKIITDVAVQSHKGHKNIVNSYQLQYTEDTILWETYEEDGAIRTFAGPTEVNDVKKENLLYYIRAYAVKINPRSQIGHMCLRMELYGIDDHWQTVVPQDVNGYPLGIEDHRIKNHQMSASWRAKDGRRVMFGRLNANSVWCNGRQTANEYIRIDFDSRKIITDVAIQGHCSKSFWVHTYKLLYTENSYAWKTYKVNGVDKLFTGSSDASTVQKNKLSYWIRAFAIKINPVTWTDIFMCIRMELYGLEDPAQPPIPSDSYGSPYSPKFARLNGNKDWCEKRGVDPANTFIQVDLTKRMVVTAVAIQGRYHYSDWVKSYYVSYGDTNGNTNWIMQEATKKVFPGAIDNNGIVKNKFDPPIRARYVRLNPKDYEDLICLRMELYGCELV